MKTTGSPQELASLYKRMAAAMAQLKRLPKRGRNERFNYAYVTDSDVLDAVRSALGSAGIGFFTDVVDIDRSRSIPTRSGELAVTELTVDAMFADSETGATVTVTWLSEAMDGQDKGINKALTGAVKYGLLKTLLVSTGEDDPDSEAATGDKGNGQKESTLHWIDDPKVRPRFWKWARDERGLTDTDVHAALNVKSVKDYTGTMEQAKMLIEAWPKEEPADA